MLTTGRSNPEEAGIYRNVSSASEDVGTDVSREKSHASLVKDLEHDESGNESSEGKTEHSGDAASPHKLESQAQNTPVRQKRMFSWLLSKDVPPIPTEDERKHYPTRRSISPLKRIFFWWLNPMLKVGYKRTLQEEDMFILNDDQRVAEMYAEFLVHFHKLALEHQKKLEAKKEEEGEKEGDPGDSTPEEESERVDLDPKEVLNTIPVDYKVLLCALFRTFRSEYMIGFVELVIADLMGAFLPMLQKRLINFVEARDLPYMNTPIGKGIGYAIGVCAMVLLLGIFINHSFYRTMSVGAKVKAVLTKLLLEKSYRLDARGHHKFPTGKLTSIMGTDLNRVDLAVGFFALLPGSIPAMIACIVLLIVNIGVSSLVGIAIFVFSFGFIGSLFKPLMKFRKQANEYTDKRVMITKELVKDFKFIKFYAWENYYEARLVLTRNTEMGFIYRMQNLRSIVMSYIMCLPTLGSMVAFCVLYALHNDMSPGDIFASLSLFQSLANQLNAIPMVMATGTDLVMALKRCAAVVSCGEIPLNGDKPNRLPDEPDVALKVDHATFAWKDFKDDDIVDQDNGDKKEKSKKSKKSKKSTKSTKSTNSEKESQRNGKNEDGYPYDTTNTATGAGDSASTVEEEKEGGVDIETSKFKGLNDINFEIKKGEFIVVTGQIGSGKSSLLNAMAGFMPKLSGEIYENGDLLLCGAPWVQDTTLRDNITFGKEFDRSKYSSVVNACSLNDDFKMLPGKDMTEVGERGVTLSGGQKARVSLARAVYADKDIILLDDVLSAVDSRVGRSIVEDCILGLLDGKTRILATHQLSLIGAADRMIFLNRDGSMDIGSQDELVARNPAFAHLLEFAKQKEEKEEKETQDIISVHHAHTHIVKDEEEVRITKDEERAVNRISYSIFGNYLKEGAGVFGNLFLPVFVLSAALSTFTSIFCNTWLSFWVEAKFPGYSSSFYIGLYIMFAFLAVIFLVYEFWMMVYLSNNAATSFNLGATKRLLHVPMSYIDTTPTGRILNRFTKDTDVADNELVEQYRMFIVPFCNIIGTLILCIIYLPWFAIAIPFLVFVFMVIANFYQSSGREVKRLEATQRSFVFSHFNESIGGMDTIKAYRASNRFLHGIDSKIDRTNEAYLITIANQRWIAVNLDIVATCLCLIIAFLCCFRVFSISASSTGLLLTYVLSMAGQMSFMLRCLTQIENEMNSVERLDYYSKHLEQEAPYEIPERDPAPEWPQSGAITFKDVYMKYRPELPYVLKDVNLDIGSGQRIGFCGRTGAGKSTIMQCLYRIVEFEGEIEIDGVNIQKIGLHALRSHLSIIPQDPVLFRGSIRENIDPFNQKTDEELWDSLRRAGLLTAEQLPVIRKQKKGDDDIFKFHLDKYVEDDGSNFSLGERQLLALARALVRGARILVLDEATSSVDYETDAKIQATIATEFSNCTILCIAHRLRTLLTYDKIAVVNAGEIIELGAPLELYDVKGSQFRSMCEQGDITRADFIEEK